MKLSTRQDKIRVVLDTNIVVSALIGKHGAPAKIFEKLILGRIENFTSNEIIEEIELVFKRREIKKRTNKRQRDFIVKNYKKASRIVQPKTKIKAVKNDPKDNKFIEAAIEAKANYIISGDPHLTSVGSYKKTKILKPKDFLAKTSGKTTLH